MFSFIIALAALVIGYIFYGKFIEKTFGADNRPTPAVTKADGVDYIVMPTWKIFMIQFLNIAGTGPIFGAIMGAKFGPSSYLWIVFGCIFAGAVHDYLSGMLSMRNEGAGLPTLVGKYLGDRTKNVMLVFTVLLLIMVGAVFVYSPAQILGGMTEGFFDEKETAMYVWIVVIFVYYIIATMMPVDKIIGRIYPLFAFSLLFMALSLLVMLFVKWPSLPELWDGLGNRTESLGVMNQPIFPCLFITIACGAISGFHATQSPLMARCVKHEKYGRPIFYGSMITEGVVALIWATVASYFFFDGGHEALGAPKGLGTSAPEVVTIVADGWLGKFGAVLALLGVVAAPITSGDTALRSARLIIADFAKLAQKTIKSRLLVCIPLFALTMLVLWFNIEKPDGFNVIWSYFGWANQTLSVFTLWTITVFLALSKKPYIITMIPAVFMTGVCTTFLFISKNSLGSLEVFSNPVIGYAVGAASMVCSVALFALWLRKQK